MIENIRIQAYIESLGQGNGEFLDALEAECIRNRIPVIRPSMQSLLKVLIGIKNPENILEVGTATGFSAILMASCQKSGGRVTTIEKYEKRIPIALENIDKSGYKDRIKLIEGDASDVLKDLVSGGYKYDFIFMDAAKGQYLNFYDDTIRLLEDGGILVSDNVLQDGDIVQSRFAVTRRNRTIHSRMREYLYSVTHDARLETTILPVGDGVTVSVKRYE